MECSRTFIALKKVTKMILIGTAILPSAILQTNSHIITQLQLQNIVTEPNIQDMYNEK